MDIRFISPEELEQLRRSVLTSFPSKTPQPLLDAMPNELVTPDEGRYLGCFDDSGELIGSVLLMDFSLNVRGILMSMGAAAYVSCSFLHKKERVAFNMLRVFVGYYDKLGVSMCCLHPFNPAFYETMGFGFCNESTMYSPKPCYVRSFGYKSDLSYASKSDQDEILAFYRRHVEMTHGATLHRFMDFHRIFDAQYVVICRRNGLLTGYLTFDFVEVDHYTDMYHDISVREMIYADFDTLQQFMTFFASQVDQIERVRLYSPDPNLHLMLKNPDSGENRAFDGAIQEIGRRCMGYMCRIVNIAQYFTIQTHTQKLSRRNFVLELHIEDSFYPHNAGIYRLSIQGSCVALLHQDSAPDVVLTADISVFSTLAMGAASLDELHTYGRLKLSDVSYIEDIQNAIGWNKKPKNYTYF